MTFQYIVYIITGALFIGVGVVAYLIIKQMKLVVVASNKQCNAITTSVNIALKQAVQTKATAILRKESRIANLPIKEPNRFTIDKLSKVGEFRVYVLVDKGLNEQYLFLESDSGRLISMGNVEDS